MPRTKTNRAFGTRTMSSVVPTTEGRKHFPDYIQDSYGKKSITGFDRYGRFLGAIVPPEAIFLLADESDEVDEFAKLRIKEYAQQLLQELRDRDEIDDPGVALDALQGQKAT